MKQTRRQTCRMILEITGTDGKRTAYAVRPIESQIPEHRRAYQVRKLSDNSVYHVTQDKTGRRECDCARNLLGGKSCRHVKALATLGLLLSARELTAMNLWEMRR